MEEGSEGEVDRKTNAWIRQQVGVTKKACFEQLH